MTTLTLPTQEHHSGPGELLERIRKRLYWDKRVSIIDVKVDAGASEGQVIVRGEVDSLFKKDAAIDLVRNTEGVHWVDDQVEVQIGLHRTDDAIKTIIESELGEVLWQKGEHVRVQVFGGVVKLTGTVYRKRTKAMAAGFCWELSGVRDCLNHILLSDNPPLAEAQLWQITHMAEEPTPVVGSGEPSAIASIAPEGIKRGNTRRTEDISTFESLLRQAF